ncbi:MAG: hypothetical protein U9R47_05345, partial [Actinomycetota bacterium]|nr:hypothetical protein [Actinomycetota bacterium]
MRKIGAFVLMAFYCATFFALLASPVSAEIEGPCSASFNGIPFDDLDTPSEARERLVIQPGESVILRATVPDTDFVYVDVLFPPLTITLAEFEADEPSDQGSDLNEVEGEIPLGDLATYGAGIFQFVGRTDDCWGNAYFVIGGVEPWETAVGKTAIGIAGVGILIGLTSWIPAIVAGGGGVVRSVIAGGPIGLGVAVLIQQAGLVPLSATSVGVAVLGSSVVAVFVTKGLAGISGALTGGGAASGAALPTPPPTSPPAASVGAPAGSPPPPAETPMAPAQDAPAPPGPDKIFVDDASVLGGEVTPVPDATLTPQPPEVPVQGGELTPGPEKIFVDDAGLLGGEVTPV